MADTLTIALLGRVRIGGGEPLPLKAQALLAYLVVTGGTHTRDSLTGLLWPDVPDKKAKGSLRVALTQLRKRFPHALHTTHTTVAFNFEAEYQLDCTRFEEGMRMLARLDSADLSPLLTLYRGPFLEGLFLGDALAFEEWVLTQRARFQQLAVRGYERLTMLSLQTGAYRQAVDVLGLWLAIEQWSELAHRQLMLAHSRLGNFSAALAQYEHCRTLLHDELGVEPMAETTALVERIRLARQRPASNLPAEDVPFFGRIREQQQLQHLLTNSDCRLITLVGLGGSGKTQLALAVARNANREHRVTFLNGIVHVALVGVDAEGDVIQTLATAIAHALDVPLSGRSSPLHAVINALRKQELLLVLDNFEPFVAHGTNVIKQILQRCHGITMLMTSREPLNLQVERRFAVEGLTAEAATTLFVQTARQVRPKFIVTDPTQIEQLCRIVGGMPLAIKLAALWLRVMSLDQIVAETERGIDLLATTLRDVPPRQRSMRVILDATWAQLDNVEQKTLAALSIFRGSFDPSAAGALAQATPLVFAALIDKGLLHLRQATNGIRYSLHELVRQYAGEKLVGNERVSAEIAHALTYLTFLKKQDSALDEADPEQARNALRQDADNIAAALQFASKHALLTSDHIDPLVRFYQGQGWSRRGLALVEQMLARQSSDSLLQGSLETAAGRFNIDMGQMQTADTHLQRGMAQAQRAENAHLIALTATQLAWVQLQRDEYALAEQLSAYAREIAEEGDEWLLHARALNTLGLLASLTMRYSLAQKHYTQALTVLRRKYRQHYATAAVLNNMAQLGWQTGRYQEAQGHSAEAVALTRRAGNRAQLPPMLQCRGRTFLLAGVFDSAEIHFRESLDLSQQLHNDPARANALDDLGKLALWRGDLAAAYTHLNASLAINQALNRPMSLAFNHDNLGQLALAQGKIDVARTQHEQSLSLWEPRQQPQWIATSLSFLAQVALAEEDVATAAQHIKRALSLVADSGLEPLQLTLLTSWGHVLLAQAEVKSALQHFVFVVAQSTTTYRTRAIAQAQLDQLALILPQAMFEMAQKSAETHTLQQLINLLL